jgi:hypothetical protein
MSIVTDPNDLPNVEWVYVGPHKASLILEKNTRNRRFRKRQVDQLATAMVEGRFYPNGDTIKIYDDNVLADGQHRLLAIIKSKTSHWLLIVSNIKEDTTRRTFDRGRKRTNADDLTIDGELNTVSLASTIAIQWRFENKCFSSTAIPDAQQSEDVLNRNPALRQAIQVGRLTRDLLPQSWGAWCFYHAEQAGVDNVRQFFSDLASGAGLDSDSPVLRLRNRLLENKIGKSRLPKTELCALTLKAIGYWRDGVSTKLLKMGTKEPFPFLFEPQDKTQ